MKKILFPTDFSKAAEHAFVYALNVAKALNASIVTLHVYTRPDIRGVNLPNILREIYEDIQLEEFENYKDEVPYLHQLAEEHGLDQIEMSHVMSEGDVVPAIVRTARKEKADLIIMGTKGATGFKEIFLGSVATKVLEKVETCPVLAIPEKAVFDGKINKIAITTNFKEEEKEAVKYLLQFAKWFNAQVYCIHVDVNHVEGYANRMSKFKESFEQYPYIHFKVIDSNTIEQGIAKWLKENHVDLLAMLTHKRDFWRSLTQPRITKQMVSHLDKPILSIQTTVLEPS